MRDLNYPAAAVEGLAADWLLPGVAFNLRRFGALIQLLAKSAWVQHIRSNPRNAPTVGGATDLELFLFGDARVDLSAARAALQDMQENRCSCSAR